MSAAETGTVPLSQPLGPGTVGHLSKSRDTTRDTGGTVDLKALARRILERDTTRDSRRDSAETECPKPISGWDTCPADWREGLGRLNPQSPAPNFLPAFWARVIRDAEQFLPAWGRQAAELGWTALDLFGAHPTAPSARVSCMGLVLVIDGGRVVAMTETTAVIEKPSGSRLSYPRRPYESRCVPLWQLQRKD